MLNQTSLQKNLENRALHRKKKLISLLLICLFSLACLYLIIIHLYLQLEYLFRIKKYSITFLGVCWLTSFWVHVSFSFPQRTSSMVTRRQLWFIWHSIRYFPFHSFHVRDRSLKMSQIEFHIIQRDFIVHLALLQLVCFELAFINQENYFICWLLC